MRTPVILIALLLAYRPVSAQCPSGGASPGIGLFVCQGGDCAVNVREDGRNRHVFTVEPEVRRIMPRGPSGGRLREGDTIVAVDGALITTRAAGESLANLEPGVPLELRVRRGGRELNVSIVPSGCSSPALIVEPRPDPDRNAQAAMNWRERADAQELERAARRIYVRLRNSAEQYARTVNRTGAEPEAVPPGTPARARVDFGIELDCGDCGWRTAGSGITWWSARPPRVVHVDPDGPAARAGVREGDVLLLLDGAAFVTANDGRTGPLIFVDGMPISSDPRVWSALRPGQAATLVIDRNGQRVELSVTPRVARSPF